jgi:predicted TIM-barrel fold metal-dependent hydrolase
MKSIYNAWLADFCDAQPGRFAGIACVPNHDVPAAVAEIERVASRGGARGLEIANSLDMLPLYHPDWNPLWAAAAAAKLPVHVHTIGQRKADTTGFAPMQQRQAFAVQITSFQMGMSRVLMEVIFGGVLETYPDVKLVIGESGIGWIPYVLEHMDFEWEEQFKDLTLKMKPSDYWHRQCKATYQSDNVGLRLLDVLGEENVMWGSDFPHPDGVWPDSQDFLEREVGHLPEATRRKVICENAANLYGFPLNA